MPVPTAIPPEGAEDNTDTQNALPDDSEVTQPGEYDFGPPEDGVISTPSSSNTSSADESSGRGASGYQPGSSSEDSSQGKQVAQDGDSLAAVARDNYGITDAEIEQMTPEALQTVMAIQDRHIAAIGRAASEQQQGAQHPVAPATFESGQEQVSDPNADPQQAQPVPAEGDRLEKYSLSIDEDWDDDVAEVLNGINDHYHSQIEKMSQSINSIQNNLVQVTGSDEQRAAEEFERSMDTYFDSLGDEWSEVFGKGPVRGLPDGSPELLNRQMHSQEFGSLMGGDWHVGREPKSFEDYCQRATRSAFGDKAIEIEKSKIGQQVTRRRRQGISRPGGRDTSPPNGRERAAQVANDFYRERGMEPTPIQAPVDI